MTPFDLCARAFEELAVVYARRTCSHTRHTAEAAIEMLDPGGRDLRSTLSGGLDEVNAAAGRVHFFMPKDVSGTGGETEAAMDTFVENFGQGRMVDVEGGLLRCGGTHPANIAEW